ncbi:hypothetical protein [Actinomadura soli]|uniref:hypothetical protein n=1 Tax=Actinomadura soli TaxID=2508997 RepID=UPI00197B003F|nr:hypothetical protein [Actinomadura soli]
MASTRTALTVVWDHLIGTLIGGAWKAGVEIRTETVEASPDGRVLLRSGASCMRAALTVSTGAGRFAGTSR